MVILEAQAVWKSFGRRGVLRGASLAVRAGERVVVVGDNGSRKSTLLLVMSGVLEPDEGRVLASGDVGFAPEKPDIPDHLLVGEWLDVIASLKGKDRPPVPDDLGIGELRGKLVGSLSLGQKQRVSLAAAFMGDPAILVLDEPTNALDAATRAAVLDRLATKTALVATHDRELAERVATRIVTVRGGTVE